MLPILESALAGLQANLDASERTAERVSREPALDRLPRDMVEMRVQRHGVAANGQTLRTVDEMVGTLLDTFA